MQNVPVRIVSEVPASNGYSKKSKWQWAFDYVDNLEPSQIIKFGPFDNSDRVTLLAASLASYRTRRNRDITVNIRENSVFVTLNS